MAKRAYVTRREESIGMIGKKMFSCLKAAKRLAVSFGWRLPREGVDVVGEYNTDNQCTFRMNTEVGARGSDFVVVLESHFMCLATGAACVRLNCEFIGGRFEACSIIASPRYSADKQQPRSQTCRWQI
jgi:hypothetical protein